MDTYRMFLALLLMTCCALARPDNPTENASVAEDANEDKVDSVDTTPKTDIVEDDGQGFVEGENDPIDDFTTIVPPDSGLDPDNATTPNTTTSTTLPPPTTSTQNTTSSASASNHSLSSDEVVKEDKNNHIYEEIPAAATKPSSRPLPPIPKNSVVSTTSTVVSVSSKLSSLKAQIDEEDVKSIFVGATKYEILHYLEDAKERGVDALQDDAENVRIQKTNF